MHAIAKIGILLTALLALAACDDLFTLEWRICGAAPDYSTMVQLLDDYSRAGRSCDFECSQVDWPE